MNTIQTMLLDDVNAALSGAISKQLGSCPLEQAFVAWLAPALMIGVNTDSIITASLGGSRTPRHCAALGILARVTPLADNAKQALLSDLRQLLGREAVVAGTPMPFCMDGLALGGVLLGVDVIHDESLNETAKHWINSCRQVTAEGKGLDLWQECFLTLVGNHVGITWDGRGVNSPKASVVKLALRSKGIGKGLAIEQEEQDEKDALDEIRSGVPAPISIAEAALRLAALAWIRRSRPLVDLRRPSVEDLCRVLHNLTHGMKRWTWEAHPKTKTSEARKWHVDHEYHVQNLLWCVLAPVFPDLDDENYTKKIGSKQPRADIVIPSLRVIVEAKFWRASESSKKIIEEIAVDASLYLAEGCPFDGLIPFIWDDARRTEQHTELVRGLKQIDGVLDAVVVSRPGSMQGA